MIEFDKIAKNASKIDNVVKSSLNGTYPSFYLKALVELDDFLKTVHEDKEAKKKMNVINAKAMTAMKQKLRKFIAKYEEQIEKWKAGGGAIEEEAPKKKKSLSSSESESEQEESSSEYEESDEDDEEESVQKKSVDRWKKAAPAAAAQVGKKQTKKEAKVLKFQTESAATDDGFTTVVSSAKKKQQQQQEQQEATKELTPEMLAEKLLEIQEARGKKVRLIN